MNKDYTSIVKNFNEGDLSNNDLLELYLSEEIKTVNDIKNLIRRIDVCIKENEIEFKNFFNVIQEVFIFFLMEDTIGRKSHNLNFNMKSVQMTIIVDFTIENCLFSNSIDIMDECLAFFNISIMRMQDFLINEQSYWNILVSRKIGNFNERSSKSLMNSDVLVYVLKNKNIRWYQSGAIIDYKDLNECLNDKNNSEINDILRQVG